MKRVIKFKDKNYLLVILEVENKEDYFSISGQVGGNCGQVQDDFEPRNKAQEDLVKFWNKYQLKKIDKATLSKINNICDEIDKAFNRRRGNEFVTEKNEIKLLDDFTIKKIALGKLLGVTVKELDEIEGREQDYSYGGNDYFIGTNEQAEARAFDYLVDDKELWVMAVQNGTTKRGLEEWAQYVVDVDSAGSILNGWDGTEDEIYIGEKSFTIIRL